MEIGLNTLNTDETLDPEWVSRVREEIREGIRCHDDRALEALVEIACVQSQECYDLTDMKSSFTGLTARSFEAETSVSDSDWMHHLVADMSHKVRMVSEEVGVIRSVTLFVWRPTPPAGHRLTAQMSLAEYREFTEWGEEMCTTDRISIIMSNVDKEMAYRSVLVIGTSDREE